MSIPEEMLGKTANCPGCGAKIRVPGPGGAAAPAGSSPQLAGPPLKTAEPLDEPPGAASAAPAANGTFAQSQPAVGGGPPPLPAGGSPEAGSAGFQIDTSGTPQIHTEPGAGSVSARVHRRGIPNAAVLAVAGLVVVGFLAVVGVGLTLIGGGSPDALRYLPADSQVVASVNFAQAYNSDLYAKLAAGNPQLAQVRDRMIEGSGVAPEEVERIVFGGSGPVVVGVMELSRPIDVDEFIERQTNGRAEQEKVGDATIYVGGMQAFHFPNDRTMVFGNAAKLREVLDPERTAGLSAGMQGLVDGLDFSRTLAMAVVVDSATARMAGGLPVQDEVVQKIRAVMLQVDVDSDVRADVEVHCQDGETAEDMKKLIDGLLALGRQNQELPAEARELIDALNLSVSGDRLRAKLTITGEQVDRFSEDLPPGMPL